ncbi:helicase-like transcription factor, partial [Trifolium medium]|nr:helicase-like transcription factor [Trifolium medium]
DAPEEAVVSVCGHVFCNQCICEHLTGEDNQCPATNCKTRLSMSSVFPKATLNSSLSNQACDHLPGYSGSVVEDSEPCSQTQPYDSSKIKAALEVLQSLSKPQGHNSPKKSVQSTSRESTDCSSTSADNGKSFSDVPEKKSSNDSVGSPGEKAIVFSQWTGMLDLLEACLKNSKIQYRRLDGTMSVMSRDKAVKDFNTLPEVSVMIMSLKAASLGLNMVAACHVLMLDLWWNPTTEDQAIDRAHRIGQTRPVTVLRLTVKDTVEDRILALQQMYESFDMVGF